MATTKPVQGGNAVVYPVPSERSPAPATQEAAERQVKESFKVPPALPRDYRMPAPTGPVPTPTPGKPLAPIPVLPPRKDSFEYKTGGSK